MRTLSYFGYRVENVNDFETCLYGLVWSLEKKYNIELGDYRDIPVGNFDMGVKTALLLCILEESYEDLQVE